VLKGLAFLPSLLFLLMAVGFLARAMPLLAGSHPGGLIFSSDWHPMRGQFGFFPFITGTLAVTALAMIVAIPPCLLSAVYLAEFACRGFRRMVKPLMDMMAGVPSVVYGLWGVLVLEPAVRRLASAAGVESSGYSLLAGSVVLAVMVCPLIISLATEVIQAVPLEARETSTALGATRWETARHVVVRHASRGILAAVVLGFSRALGETMAVMMVVGNVARVPDSLFAPAYPLPALIANTYGEMMSIPLYDSAVMLAALLLFVIVTAFNVGAYAVLRGRVRHG